jgi:diaminohydroxyphosphoribosylaminopyrimidine deaminase / 5-amino-6-(5-phosphoribosylamino)uracil reductase
MHVSPDPELEPFTPSDAAFMRLALALAERGRGRVSPNPLVGCVVVKDGEVVGEGWHARAGGPHAELAALAAAGERARGATVYVTLEPCDHHGRTPPCTDALLTAGVERVVAATLDPNPLVDGRGVARLKQSGVRVDVGLLAQEAEHQNEVFRVAQYERRPFVLYKTAMSLDGKIAVRTGRSRWITGETSRDRVHRWRDEFDAVAVGINTVLLDDPALTTRIAGGHTPRKVVFDSVARTPTTARLFDDDPQGEPGRVTVFVTDEAPATRVEALKERGAEVVAVRADRGRPSVAAALSELYAQDVTSLLLEGGGTLAWDFFAARSVDRVAWFVAPKLLGGSAAGPLAGLGVASVEEAFELEDVHTETIGHDLLVTGKVRYPEPRETEGA